MTLVISLSQPVGADEPEEILTIGIFAYRPVEQMERMWEPTARFIETALGNKRVVLRILNQDEMAKAIELGKLDVVFTNPTHYIRLRAANRLSGAIATQVTLENSIPFSELGGVVIRRKDRSDISSLFQLQGKRIAIPGKEYLGGYLAQAMLFKDLGIPLSSIEFVSLGNPHDKIVAAVLQGSVDAGFIRTG